MNFITLSGLYENSRVVVRLLNRDHFAQQLEVIAKNPKLCDELQLAIQNLESHARVLGLEEIDIFNTK